MIFSHKLARVSFLGFLGLVMLAGTAQAQVNECLLPENVPGAVHTTIQNRSDISFGSLSQKICDGIVKRGVALCKAQTKANAKCYLNALAGNLAIQIRECSDIGDPTMRKSCVASHKADRASAAATVRGSLAIGLTACETSFAAALNDTCINGVM